MPDRVLPHTVHVKLCRNPKYSSGFSQNFTLSHIAAVRSLRARETLTQDRRSGRFSFTVTFTSALPSTQRERVKQLVHRRHQGLLRTRDEFQFTARPLLVEFDD